MGDEIPGSNRLMPNSLEAGFVKNSTNDKLKPEKKKFGGEPD